MDGRLRKIYKDLQYGFIQNGDKSYFFHKTDYHGDWNSLCNDFNYGQDVHLEFKHTMTDKGLRAVEVQLSDV